MLSSKHNKHKSSAGKVIGAGIIGIVLGAIAGVFMAPKSGKENLEDVQDWMKETQDEITEKVESAREFSQDRYDQIVEEVASRRKTLGKIKDSEWESTLKDLKKHWHKAKEIWDKENK